jgi:hypothetical protein
MREILFTRVLRMIGPALRKAEKRSGVLLSESGSVHLHVIVKEVSRVAELCIGQGNPTRFRGVRVGFIMTGASVLLIRRLLPCDGGVKQSAARCRFGGFLW